jgi:tRNA threonylcarbamoyladenosine biosynthesis protein TsaB
MLRFIALDASSDSCSVTLVNGSERNSRSSTQVRSHALELLPFVDELLTSAGISPKQLDFVACCHGPGSFTGLRIGASVAQGLAFGANLPMVGVSSLAAMAQRVYRETPMTQGGLITLLDAHMSEIYWGVYAAGDQQPRCLVAPKLSGVQTISAEIDQFIADNPQEYHYVGIATDLMAHQSSAIKKLPHFMAISSNSDAVADISQVLWNSGNLSNPNQFELMYLRNSISWNKRQRIRSQNP